MEFNFCGKTQAVHFKLFAQGFEYFLKEGTVLEIVRGTKLIIRAANANSRGVT